MGCPRCGGELVMQDVFTGGRHATVAACLACSGQWMRDSDLERLSEVVEPVPIEIVRVAPDSVQGAEIECPECEEPRLLSKIHSPRDPRVVLDACDVCGGVWLDENELSAIQRESVLKLLAGVFRSRSQQAAHP